MTTRNYILIPRVLKTVLEFKTKYSASSILDLGCGAGLYGALLRQYLDYNCNRVPRRSWRARIQGVEHHYSFQTPNWKHYDNVAVAAVEEFASAISCQFDIILMLDVLEHLPLDRARELLLQAYRKTKACMIVAGASAPLQPWLPRRQCTHDAQRPRPGVTPEILESLFPRTCSEELGAAWIAVVKNQLLPLR